MRESSQYARCGSRSSLAGSRLRADWAPPFHVRAGLEPSALYSDRCSCEYVLYLFLATRTMLGGSARRAAWAAAGLAALAVGGTAYAAYRRDIRAATSRVASGGL